MVWSQNAQDVRTPSRGSGTERLSAEAYAWFLQGKWIFTGAFRTFAFEPFKRVGTRFTAMLRCVSGEG
jgi:hypothetical protein